MQTDETGGESDQPARARPGSSHRKVLAAGAVAILAVTLILHTLSQRPRQLLDRATHIRLATRWCRDPGSYVWISNTRVVHFGGTQEHPTMLLDTVTGRESDSLLPRPPAGGAAAAYQSQPAVFESVQQPGGGRIAQLVLDESNPEFLRPLRGPLNAIGCGGRFWLRLRVSDGRGSSFHDIGSQDLSNLRTGEIIPNCLVWLPDGKHVSLLFRDSLYIVSVGRP